MKITINYTKKELDGITNIASNVGCDLEEINDMINDFEFSGTNFKAINDSYKKEFTIEISDKIVSRMLKMVLPIIDMAKGLVKLIMNFCEDIAEEFEDVKLKSCLSKSIKEQEEAKIKTSSEKEEENKGE